MTDIPIEQALFHRLDHDKPSVQARSAGFKDEWLTEAEALIVGFGDRPAGTRCPRAIFAYPLATDQVALVHVADQNNPEVAGRLTCGYHFFVLPRVAYERLYGDPFALARLLPPSWQARGTLPEITLPATPLPPRTVQEIQQVLQRLKAGALPEDEDPQATAITATAQAVVPAGSGLTAAKGDPVRTPENSESPALLGGVQVLVDGGRVVFERKEADTGLIPALWTLLPTRSRCQLWPASFAFGNALGFDALVVPRAQGDDFAGYTTEDQAEEYPQGQYELGLQIAVEAGDQRALNSLLNRRTWAETWRLAITLIVLFLILALLPKILALVDALMAKQNQ
ncbi:MAG TPA: hypothetical protein VKE98_22365 [Gemmataceae bacterium]|nr:hypothetical protein [Gemmataceae bacterium]